MDPLNPSPPAVRLPALLPAIYRDTPFLRQYLGSFEQILTDLESKIDGIADYFDPAKTPEGFLPWLSSWMAFTLRSDLSIKQQRGFLANVIPLYRRRGTKQNLLDLLSIFTVGTHTIVEGAADGSPQPYHFHVTISLARSPPEMQLQQGAIAKALIELEKPAHTQYDLVIDYPTIQVGVSSTVGQDTLIGLDQVP
jgi:phage tail-like protein